MTQLLLVVSTHRGNGERLVAALDRSGYIVEPAEAEEEACLRLDEGRYDAVVVDLQPAGPAGFEVLRAVRALCSYRWPGNVRELQHALEGAVAVARRPIIRRDDLPAEVIEARRLRIDGRMRGARSSKGATDEHHIPFTAG